MLLKIRKSQAFEKLKIGWSALVLVFYFGYTSFIAYGVFEAFDTIELVEFDSFCSTQSKDTGFAAVFNIIAFTWVVSELRLNLHHSQFNG